MESSLLHGDVLHCYGVSHLVIPIFTEPARTVKLPKAGGESIVPMLLCIILLVAGSGVACSTGHICCLPQGTRRRERGHSGPAAREADGGVREAATQRTQRPGDSCAEAHHREGPHVALPALHGGFP